MSTATMVILQFVLQPSAPIVFVVKEASLTVNIHGNLVFFFFNWTCCPVRKSAGGVIPLARGYINNPAKNTSVPFALPPVKIEQNQVASQGTKLGCHPRKIKYTFAGWNKKKGKFGLVTVFLPPPTTNCVGKEALSMTTQQPNCHAWSNTTLLLCQCNKRWSKLKKVREGRTTWPGIDQMKPLFFPSFFIIFLTNNLTALFLFFVLEPAQGPRLS